MSMIRLQCYSAQKYDECGNGRCCVEYDPYKEDGTRMSDDEIAIKNNEIRNDFKALNAEYRENRPKRNLISTKNIIIRHGSTAEGNRTVEEKPELLKTGTLLSKKPIIVSDFKDLQLDLDTGNTTFILGSSKMGKSTLLMNIYKNYYSKDFISTLFSINCHIPLYKKGSKKLLKCCKFNKECVDLIKMMKRLQFVCKNKHKFSFIFDDITDVRYNQIVNDLILTYRNSLISSVVSLQYPNMLAKSSRSSINNLIFFGFNTDECIKVVLDSFLKSYFTKAGIIGEANQINFYRELTKDHQFIYLHPQSGFIGLYKLSIPKK